ncbi:hypothetical protein CABS01_12364 [Colletotrichum abscissum]|uniref:uncharacterized protein n=1 Tax=Colletotrichum abscissum TaxID=1671311 RepID=UPI0027D65F91|nr:uncharacterized protein CABS01_12364 [Colletotrichum abscissum]KAK1490564.1 hypothetical protein CABS01_12364 [Colletotrichum abscissum]
MPVPSDYEYNPCLALTHLRSRSIRSPWMKWRLLFGQLCLSDTDSSQPYPQGT